MISVILVDQHEVVRTGMKAIINSVNDIAVRADGASIPDLLTVLGSSSDDILVTELALTGSGGIDNIRRIRQKYTALRILVFTLETSVDVADRALKAGAQGYITKRQLRTSDSRSDTTSGERKTPDQSTDRRTTDDAASPAPSWERTPRINTARNGHFSQVCAWRHQHTDSKLA